MSQNHLNNTGKFFQKIFSPLEKLIHLETSGGIVLLITTLIALFWANSPLSYLYSEFIHLPIKIQIGTFKLEKSFQHWVNDGMMVIFFFVVGLEIKRELYIGELSSRKKAALPLFAALGGMIFPALIYLTFNPTEPTVKGWGIPMATDIAFAIGILSLLSHRIPFSLKVFLLALAIVDDLGAVFVIAFFYTENISKEALAAVVFTLALMQIMKLLHVRKLKIYIFLGILNWLAFLKSGIHATVAGVIWGFMTPLTRFGKEKKSPLEKYSHALHPWVSFFIMPLFALTNAGVSFQKVSLAYVFSHPISHGIFLGLILGKPLGVFLFSFLSVKAKWASLPQKVNWIQILGVGTLSGIGFTMSIFISLLAFKNYSNYVSYSKISILFASLISGLLGAGLLLIKIRKKPNTKNNKKEKA